MFKTVGSAFAVAVVFLGSNLTQESVKVEVNLATKHVPAGLKAGDRVDLHRVNSETSAENKEVYSLTPVAPNLEVISMTQVEKPKEPNQAVKVELKATKDQAQMIEKMKNTIVTVGKRDGQGNVVTENALVILRLELAAPTKK